MRTRSTVRGFTRISAVVAVAAMLTLGPLSALADDGGATPGAVAVGCETAAIDALRYAEAAADTSDDVAIPGPVPYAPPVGEAAPAETVERVGGLVGQVVACVNEGRNAAFLSLFTVAFLERHAAELGGEPEDTAPEPVGADMRLSLVRVADVTVLEDGRVAALVVFDQAEREAPELTSLLTFRELVGRLLIDAWQTVTLPVDDGGTPVVGAWETISGEGYTGVIVPVDQAPAFGSGMTTEPSGFWLPDAGLLAELEAGLPGYLRTVDDARANAIAGKVGSYRRQYAGLVVEGRAVVYVDALCESAAADGRWTFAPVFVADGGDCFFQVSWEPATGQFRGLAINGDA